MKKVGQIRRAISQLPPKLGGWAKLFGKFNYTLTSPAHRCFFGRKGKFFLSLHARKASSFPLTIHYCACSRRGAAYVRSLKNSAVINRLQQLLFVLLCRLRGWVNEQCHVIAHCSEHLKTHKNVSKTFTLYSGQMTRTERKACPRLPLFHYQAQWSSSVSHTLLRASKLKLMKVIHQNCVAPGRHGTPFGVNFDNYTGNERERGRENERRWNATDLSSRLAWSRTPVNLVTLNHSTGLRFRVRFQFQTPTATSERDGDFVMCTKKRSKNKRPSQWFHPSTANRLLNLSCEKWLSLHR